MPELPEVQTIVNYLRPILRGKKILGCAIMSTRILRYHKNQQNFIKQIFERKIKEVNSRGKYIILELSSGQKLVFHLMMTGQILLNPRDNSIHDRCIFKLSGNNKLVFRDVRQFGFCKIVSSDEALAGDDALKISFLKFRSLISQRKGIIKNILVNQKIISGIGNIYSDEILWEAGVHPKRASNSLSDSELRNIYRAVNSILKFAIKKEGSSMRDYKKPDGKSGGYYEIRKVYRRTGEKCLRCGGIIKRILNGQRSTHFCPKHQK